MSNHEKPASLDDGGSIKSSCLLGGEHDLSKLEGAQTQVLDGSIDFQPDATPPLTLAALLATPNCPKQRERVHIVFSFYNAPMTPEEVTTGLNDLGFPDMLQSIRPRCSELMRMGLIENSGLHGRGVGGGKAIKWRVKSPPTS